MRVKQKYLFFALIIVLSASCATKRPIIFRDPSFKDYSVLENQCAFLLWDSINIRSMVQDFITAFDGDPASGESFIREFMVDCLTGRQKIYISQSGKSRVTPWNNVPSARGSRASTSDGTPFSPGPSSPAGATGAGTTV